jgi:hypothetical protein
VAKANLAPDPSISADATQLTAPLTGRRATGCVTRSEEPVERCLRHYASGRGESPGRSWGTVVGAASVASIGGASATPVASSSDAGASAPVIRRRVGRWGFVLYRGALGVNVGFRKVSNANIARDGRGSVDSWSCSWIATVAKVGARRPA